MLRRRCNVPQVRRLKTFPLFSTCSRRQLSRVDSLTCDLHVEAGRVLTLIGQPGREFFIVMSGTATVFCHGVELERVGPGSFFGELALLYRRYRAATVVADTDMDLLVMSVREFWSPHFLVGPVKDVIFATAAERLCRADAAWAARAQPTVRTDLLGLSSPEPRARASEDETVGRWRESVRSLP